MQIAVYSKEMGRNIVRISMEYCQRFNCYPAIERYSEKDQLLCALKSQNIDIVILESNRQDATVIVKTAEEENLPLYLIWISTEELWSGDDQKRIQKRQDFNDTLVEKIENGLAEFGVPAAKDSICRVHLKSEQKKSQ